MWQELGLAPSDFGVLGPLTGVFAYGVFHLIYRLIDRRNKADVLMSEQQQNLAKRLADQYEKAADRLEELQTQLAKCQAELARTEAQLLIAEAENARLRRRVHDLGERSDDKHE